MSIVTSDKPAAVAVTVPRPPTPDGKKSRSVPRGNPLTKREGWSALLFLSPTLLVFSVFILFPVIFSFYLSFHKWNMFGTERTFVGLNNYTTMLHTAEFWQVLKHTLIYTLGTVPLNMVLSLVLALFLNQKIIGKKFLRTAFFTPVIISAVAAGVIWRWLLDPNFGSFNYFLSFFAFRSLNWTNDPKLAMTALISSAMRIANVRYSKFAFDLEAFVQLANPILTFPLKGEGTFRCGHERIQNSKSKF